MQNRVRGCLHQLGIFFTAVSVKRSIRAFLSPLLSGYQAFVTVSLDFFLKTWRRKIQSEMEGGNWWWTSNAALFACLFQNKVMFKLKTLLISDQPLLRGQPPLSTALLGTIYVLSTSAFALSRYPLPRPWLIQISWRPHPIIVYKFVQAVQIFSRQRFLSIHLNTRMTICYTKFLLLLFLLRLALTTKACYSLQTLDVGVSQQRAGVECIQLFRERLSEKCTRESPGR